MIFHSIGWVRGVWFVKVISSSMGSKKLAWWFFILILSIDIFDAISNVGGKNAFLNIITFPIPHTIKKLLKSQLIYFLELILRIKVQVIS